jgi:hypothetical protein
LVVVQAGRFHDSNNTLRSQQGGRMSSAGVSCVWRRLRNDVIARLHLLREVWLRSLGLSIDQLAGLSRALGAS